MRIGMPKRKSAEPNSPRVGIIYFVDGELLIESTPLGRAGRYGDFRIHERGHIDYWAELVQRGTVPNSEYEEFTRGRVAYHLKSSTFGLLADSCILNQEKVLGKIFSQLNIPLGNTVIGTDSHYRCFRCLGHSR